MLYTRGILITPKQCLHDKCSPFIWQALETGNCPNSINKRKIKLVLVVYTSLMKHEVLALALSSSIFNTKAKNCKKVKYDMYESA